MKPVVKLAVGAVMLVAAVFWVAGRPAAAHRADFWDSQVVTSGPSGLVQVT